MGVVPYAGTSRFLTMQFFVERINKQSGGAAQPFTVSASTDTHGVVLIPHYQHLCCPLTWQGAILELLVQFMVQLIAGTVSVVHVPPTVIAVLYLCSGRVVGVILLVCLFYSAAIQWIDSVWPLVPCSPFVCVCMCVCCSSKTQDTGFMPTTVRMKTTFVLLYNTHTHTHSPSSH